MKKFTFELKSVKYLVVLFIALFAMPSFLHAQHLNHATTWIGNSWSGEPGYMPCALDDIFVCSDGTVYLNTYWDENRNKHVQLNQNGDYIDGVSPFVGDRLPIHGNEGGYTCAANSTYIYFASIASTDYNWNTSRAIIRRNRSDIDAGHKQIDHAGTIKIFGLACTDTRVYAACNDNKVRVYDQNLVSVTSWSVTAPGEMCFDADGKLWILNTSGNTIYRYDVNGTKLSQQINLASGVNARDVAITSDNRLLVANAGVDCNILIYNNLNSTPTLSTTFGPTGGAFSGIAGKLEGNKFFHPTGVGTDNAGNIYVASGTWGNGWDFSQGQVWSFTSSGTLRWRRGGTIFMDCMDFDRSTDGTILYSGFYKYNFDYNSSTPNRLPEAITINYNKYKNELRTALTSFGGGSNTGTYLRVINNKKFLYLLQDGGDPRGVWIYRFNSSTDGEIAIPCGYIRRDIGKVWYDANANGEEETSEQTTVSYNHYGGVWIDSKGDIWFTSDSEITKFPLQQIDGNGVPQYTAASKAIRAVPSTTTIQPRRMRYFPANDPSGYSDVMFLGGESPTEPKDHWKVMGPVICRYDNWSSSQTKAWEIVVPHEHSGEGHESTQPICFDVAGDYVFVAYTAVVPNLNIVRGEVKLFNTSDGTGIGYMQPTAEMSEIGLQDIVESMRAYKRSNGEYIILIEDNGKTKNVMYRWCPTGDCPECTTSVEKVEVSQANLSIDGLDTVTLSATVFPDTVCYSTVAWYSSDEDIVKVNYKGEVRSVGVGFAYVKAVSELQTDKADSCLVTVNYVAVNGITFNSDSIVVPVTKSIKLLIDFEPNNAINRKIDYVSTDTLIATVDTFGIVTGISEGSTKIIATSDDGGYKDTCTVNAIPIPVTGVSFNHGEIGIWLNDSIALNAIVQPDDANNKKLNWISLSPDTAVVDQNGIVKGLLLGPAKIVAVSQDGGFSDTCDVSVLAVGQFENQDIGNVCVQGSLNDYDNEYILTAGGADIWNSFDAFHFAYRNIVGDGVIIARVKSVSETDDWAKAGVMMRETLDPGSKHANMFLTPGTGSSFQHRIESGGSSSHNSSGDTITAPYWVKLVRQNNVLTSYKSASGRAWTKVGEITIEMNPQIYVGLCLTSHNDCVLNTSTFDNVVISNNIDTILDIPNISPIVQITSPANNSSYEVNKAINIIASASDDDAVAKVEFYEGATLIGADNSNPYSINYTFLTDGAKSITAKAIDSEGSSTISSPALLNIQLTGINAINDNERVNLFPNPVNKTLYFSVNAEKIEIFGLEGTLILLGNGKSISVAGLNKGVYLAKIKDQNNYTTKLFIKE